MYRFGKDILKMRLDKRQTVNIQSSTGRIRFKVCCFKIYKRKRNVTASPDRIVIGAGVGVLLNILASLFDKDQTVSFPDKSFVQGIGILMMPALKYTQEIRTQI